MIGPTPSAGPGRSGRPLRGRQGGEGRLPPLVQRGELGDHFRPVRGDVGLLGLASRGGLRPSQTGRRSIPSIGADGGTSAPAAAAKVGSRSSEETSASERSPAGTVPGRERIIGTCTPPSKRLYFVPSSGALSP